MDRKIKILICEDQVITSMTLTDNLQALGYTVSGVSTSAEQALELLEEGLPDIILMDIFLKGEMTGIEATEIICKKYQIPVIFITASTNEKIFEKAKIEGVYGYIIKPFDIKEIKISIEIALFKFGIEQKIKKDKYFLNEAQRIAHVGHWDLNIITGELKWSDETFRIFEVDPSIFGASYDTFLSLIHPDDKKIVDKAYTDSLINKNPYIIEHRLLFNDGRVKYVKESCETFFNSEGEPISSLGTVQDITSTKIAELALKQSEKNFKELYINSIDEVYLVDFNSFKIISVNSTVLNELGYSEAELKEMTVFDIANNKGHVKETKEKVSTLKFNETLNFRTSHIRKDGSIYPIEIKVKKIIYAGKEVMLGLAQNITEKLAFENQKEDDRKVRSALNTMLSMTLEDKPLKNFLDEALALILSLPFFKNLSKAAIFTIKDENTLELTSHVNFEEEHFIKCQFVKKGFCMCGISFETKEVQFACCNENQYEVDLIAKQNIGNYNVPIKNKDKVLGVLSVYLQKHHPKDEREIDVLKTIANTLGIIILRKINQEALKQSESRFRELAETIKEIFEIIDFKTKRVLYVSPAYEDIYEKTCQSLYDDEESWQELIHPEDKGRVIKEYQQLRNEGVTLEFRLLMPDGRIKWLQNSTFPIYENNKVARIAGYTLDVSQKKLIEQSLIESENRYRSLFENNLSGIYRISLDLKILEANDALAKILGCSSQNDIIGKETKEIYDREIDFFGILNENGGELKSFENFVVLKSNKKRVRILENVVLVKSDDGEPLYYEGSVIDTTSLLEVEIEKKAFEIIPAENPNPVIRVDYDFKVLYYNNPGNRLLAKIGENQFITNLIIVKALKGIISKEKRNDEIEFKIDHKHYLLFVSNILQYQYINIYAADITELKNTQADYLKLSLDLELLVVERTDELNNTVEKLNKEIKEKSIIEEQIKNSLHEKEVLLNEITHRVKNNLQVVSSLLSLQKETLENKESINLLNETGHRIKSMALIHETLYKSNNFSHINIKNYIDSLVYYIVNSYNTSYININCDIEDLEFTIDTATSCGMIIMELITNSLKYAFKEKEIGNIFLRLSKLDSENYLLVISDNGKGFSDEMDITKTKTLGMQLVMGLTAQLQGTIKKIPTDGTHYEIIFKDTKKHKYAKN